MQKRVAFLFPGQGAQYVGMGRDFFEKYPVFARLVARASTELDLPLQEIMFEDPRGDLGETFYSQIALFLLSMGLLEVLREKGVLVNQTFAMAGLSLGEISALVGSGRLSFSTGLALVAARGRAMQRCSINHPGGLAVIMNLPLPDIERWAEATRARYLVWVANINAPLQVVIAGVPEALELAHHDLSPMGAKVIRLAVSCASHCPLMDGAVEELRPVIDQLPLEESPVKLIMNSVAEAVNDPNEIRQNLLQQLTAPVLWKDSMGWLGAHEVALYIEIGSKKLTALNKRNNLQGVSLGLETVADLERILTAF